MKWSRAASLRARREEGDDDIVVWVDVCWMLVVWEKIKEIEERYPQIYLKLSPFSVYLPARVVDVIGEVVVVD